MFLKLLSVTYELGFEFSTGPPQDNGMALEYEVVD